MKLPLTFISSRIIEYSGTFCNLAVSLSIGDREAPHDCKVNKAHIRIDVTNIFFVEDICKSFYRLSKFNGLNNLEFNVLFKNI